MYLQTLNGFGRHVKLTFIDLIRKQWMVCFLVPGSAVVDNLSFALSSGHG